MIPSDYLVTPNYSYGCFVVGSRCWAVTIIALLLLKLKSVSIFLKIGPNIKFVAKFQVLA